MSRHNYDNNKYFNKNNSNTDNWSPGAGGMYGRGFGGGRGAYGGGGGYTPFNPGFEGGGYNNFRGGGGGAGYNNRHGERGGEYYDNDDQGQFPQRAGEGGYPGPPPGFFAGPPPPHGYPPHGYHGGYQRGFGGYGNNWEDYSQNSHNNWNSNNKGKSETSQKDQPAREETATQNKSEENGGEGGARVEEENEEMIYETKVNDSVIANAAATQCEETPVETPVETSDLEAAKAESQPKDKSSSQPDMNTEADDDKPAEVMPETKHSVEDTASSEYDFDKSLVEDQMISPVSSRRKQTTPTKKCATPGEPNTVLITHAGQVPSPTTSPAKSPRKTRKVSAETKQKQKERQIEKQKEKQPQKESAELTVKKKRGRPFKVKPIESETDTESPKTPKSPRKTQKKNASFAVPKSSPTIQRLEGEETPQRRRSKGEMKEFPVAASTPVASSGAAQENKSQIFNKVEDDLKEIIDGMSDSVDECKEEDKIGATITRASGSETVKTIKPYESAQKKRGQKSKCETKVDAKAKYGPEKKEKVTPGRERSKRQSAQTASLKLHETSDEEDFLFSKNDSKSTKNDTKSDKAEVVGSSGLDKSVDKKQEKLILETSVERPRKLVKKEMRESLLTNVSRAANVESQQTESDEEQEEKRVELIKSMIKSIESTGAKKGRKRKFKPHHNDSTDVENSESIEQPEMSNKVPETNLAMSGEKRNTRSRRSRTSEDSINKLLDSPASTRTPNSTPVVNSDESPATTTNSDTSKQAKGGVKTSDSVEHPKPKVKRGRKPKKSIDSLDTENDTKKENPSTENLDKSQESKLAQAVELKPFIDVINTGKGGEALGDLKDSSTSGKAGTSYVPLEVKPQLTKNENSDLAFTKKVDIKITKIDTSSNDDEVNTPVKKSRGRKSVEGEDESKVTPGKVSKRASRRTRGIKSEESSSSFTEEKEKASETTPAEIISEGEKSIIAETEKSPKKRGRKPGSKNKPKTAKIQDENVDSSNKLQKNKNRSNIHTLWEKLKGPFIHIDGSFRSPSYVRVVNSSTESLKPSTSKKQYGIHDQEIRSKTSSFGPSSTLNNKYDYRNADPSWVCFFCQKQSHYQGLGDLFGPYYVPSRIIKSREPATSSESPKKGAKKRRKSEILEVSVAPPPSEGCRSEIWFHEDCLIWVPCSHMVGGRLVGLEDAVSQCQDLLCSVCFNRGSSVGCTVHGCKMVAHVHCAKQDNWSLEMHHFAVSCNKHSK